MMKRCKFPKHRAAFAAIAFLAAGQSALAADFTFNVPVNYTNLVEEAESVRVTCYIFTDGSGEGNIVGSNSASMPVSNGQAVGTVTVEVDYGVGAQGDTASFTPRDVSVYRCYPILCLPQGSSNQPCRRMSAFAPVAYRTAPGTQVSADAIAAIEQ